MNKNTTILIAIVTFLAGGVIGYFAANVVNPLSPTNLRLTGQMMKDTGSGMMEMGGMMMSGGAMLRERGGRYNDSEMVTTGDALEEHGQMMQDQGSGMMGRGGDMLQMMK